MKKLIGLSAACLITAMAIAQDTIPTAKQTLPNSMKTDTIPGSNKWNTDTSALGRTNNNWQDTSMKKNFTDSSLGSNNNAKWPDTSNSATMQHQKDTSASATTQTTTGSTDSSASTTKAVIEDKVIMRDEKVYVVKNGDSTLLADSLTLPSGAVVKNDASVKFKDGSVTKLKNGQYISLKPAPAEPATKADASTATSSATTTTTSTSSTTTAAATPPAEDRVVMKDDQVFVVKNGDSTVLADSIKLSSGAVVNKDGSVRFKNGSTTKLKNGQFIALNTTPAAETKKTKTTKTTKATKKQGK